MFGHAFFGASYWGPDYWGPSASGAVVTSRKAGAIIGGKPRRASRPFQAVEDALAAIRHAKERVEQGKRSKRRAAFAELEATEQALVAVLTQHAEQVEAAAIAAIAADLERAAEASQFTDTLRGLTVAKIAAEAMAARIRQQALDEDEDDIAILLAA